MTNWCKCEVRIAGQMGRVREFLGFAKGHFGGAASVFDFNRFVPGPRISAYSTRFDSWHFDNWGTKSNAVGATYRDFVACESELTAVVLFETAWTEPRPIIVRASELFSDLRFELHYFEPLGDFAGFFRCADGVVSDDNRWACERTYGSNGVTP